ncbi:hypothetical protein CTAYLR_008732 [Chrysophaeum taylorii]|uniref:Fe2OG dioxygenase domain-containing protein n=1 Tax=Chrysophaeum taylorii TaxID=2483200 RepID=A0AAD7ULK2_9STRA|nr:hypothetical protein CTAYLR_008732 [Chrysophaeum taylorii]
MMLVGVVFLALAAHRAAVDLVAATVARSQNELDRAVVAPAAARGDASTVVRLDERHDLLAAGEALRRRRHCVVRLEAPLGGDLSWLGDEASLEAIEPARAVSAARPSEYYGLFRSETATFLEIRFAGGAALPASANWTDLDAMRRTLLRVADRILDSLGCDPRLVDRADGPDVSATVQRVCRYAPAKTTEAFGAHTDTTFLTLVPFAECPGLELFDGEAWLCPEAVADAQPSRDVLVLPGELLDLVSYGTYRAAAHRVIAPPRHTQPKDLVVCAGYFRFRSMVADLKVVVVTAATVVGVVAFVHSRPDWSFATALLMDVVLLYAAWTAGSFLTYNLAVGKTPKARWLPPGLSLCLLVAQPEKFWARLRALALSPDSGGAAIFQLLGTRAVLCADRAMMRVVTMDDEHFDHYAHPNARWLFYTTTQNQLIVMPNEIHGIVRAQFHAFLSTTALASPTGIVERVWTATHEYVSSILCSNNKESADVDVRVWTQALLAHLMLTNVRPGFADGEALPEGTTVWDVCRDIQTFTLGFLSLPIPWRPFGLGEAIAAGERVIDIIMIWIKSVRESPAETHKSRGFLETWMDEIKKEPATSKMLSDRDVAVNVLDMVFASQDATNSAVCFAVGYLATHPDAVARLRLELARNDTTKSSPAQFVAHNDLFNNFILNLLSRMPPVPMTLRIAKKRCTLAGDKPGPPVRILPGDVIVQSIEALSDVHNGSHNVTPDDLFAPPTDPNFVRALTFGMGRHKCPGKFYAILVVKLIVAAIVADVDLAPLDYDPAALMYYPTIFPTKSTFRLTPRDLNDKHRA